MDIRIGELDERDYTRVHAFQCEYLDAEELADFVHRVRRVPNLYLVAWDGRELVGICYGHPSKQDETVIVLQGIAVNLDESKGYARTGIGSKLLRSFEGAVKRRRFRKIGVGSADDVKVEHFYLKNGFHPIELVVKDSNYDEMERLTVRDYDSGNRTREQLRLKYRPREVIFIFEKSIR